MDAATLEAELIPELLVLGMAPQNIFPTPAIHPFFPCRQHTNY